jgi:hypothetical protein
LPSEHENRSSTAKGFAGLSYLASDVDAFIASATKKANAARRRSAAATTASSGSNSKQSGGLGQRSLTQSPRTGSTGRWLWGAGAVLFGVWIIGISSNSSEPSPVRPASSAQSTAGLPTTLFDTDPDPLAGKVAARSPERASRLRETSPSLDPVEQLPPIGPDRVLNAAQIRYCLSEKVRIDAARDAVNNNADIRQFNLMINDYNARCGSYRYHRQVFESVQRDVQARGTSLQAEGIARFQR